MRPKSSRLFGSASLSRSRARCAISVRMDLASTIWEGMFGSGARTNTNRDRPLGCIQMADNFGCHRILTGPIGSHANSKNRVRPALAQTHEAQLRESRLTPAGTLLSKVGEIFGRIRHVKSAAIRGHQSQAVRL